ncbi:Trans-enoyl reductase ACTTS2 [Fusarium oxysporum f. sp. cubense]|uniref:Trans-enoyl reductase ACTTS2 n=1 Tax=Fusarium oxysporum f. sp. cubense TaxID=61366 RepID=A0A559KRY6_FUSOC|nr:Trans-enoyl reductase ACTTS2 [Fusarium oxysporum f. sp. cubense]
MKALVASRGILNRSINLVSGKSIGKGIELKEISKPTISETEVLVKVHATALNPIDFKFIDFIAPPGSLVGCDFAGVVAEVGSAASRKWKVGDRVAGFVQGGVSQDRGAFAEYVKAEEDLIWRIPESVSDETASTFGVSAVTAMQALHLHLDVPWLEEVEQEGKIDKGSPVLIYAGSTTVGLFAIQIAKKAGCTVVTTASPHSFDLVKSYGADHVFDYRSSSMTEDIKKAFPNISRALDCFSEGNSSKLCAEIIQGNGDKVVTLLDTKTKVAGVESQMIMSFQLLGREFAWLPPIGPKYPVSPTERAALARFYQSLPSFTKNLKSPPLTVLNGGFSDIMKGLDMLRRGKVSGSKLVVKM